MGLAGLDLIPDDYRNERRARRLLAWFLPVFCLAIAVIGGTRFMLERERGKNEQEIERLRGDISFSGEQQSRLDGLHADERVLAQRVKILESLRGGLPVQSVFSVIDDAFNEETWFRRWSFKRRGDLSEIPATTTHAGYLIIVSETPTDPNSPGRAWRLETHMEIAGSALNHTSLASFVERLLAREEIADVKIIRTGSRREAKHEIIDFDLAVTVRGSAEA